MARKFTKYPSNYVKANSAKTDIQNLIFIRKQAKKVALHDGYDQVIIENNEVDETGNPYSFTRKYPGCCPAWQGTIIEEVNLIRENGNLIALINEV